MVQVVQVPVLDDVIFFVVDGDGLSRSLDWDRTRYRNLGCPGPWLGSFRSGRLLWFLLHAVAGEVDDDALRALVCEALRAAGAGTAEASRDRVMENGGLPDGNGAPLGRLLALRFAVERVSCGGVLWEGVKGLSVMAGGAFRESPARVLLASAVVVTASLLISAEPSALYSIKAIP